MGQQSVSNFALISTDVVYMSTLWSTIMNYDVDRTIDIFGRRNGRDSYFFSRAL